MMLPLIGLLTVSLSPSVDASPEPPPIIAPVSSEDQTDVITLKSGKEIACRVLLEGDEVVLARVGARKKEFQRSEIEGIHSIERSLREFFGRYDQLADKGTDGLANLALYCEENDLPAEARTLWIRILLADPENEQAWTKLGGSYSKRRGWRMKVRGRYYSLEQLRERVADWKNAMETPTAHFLIKSDVDPERVLNVALNVERAYLAYYDLFGEILDLQVFDQIPEIHIYKDAARYPTSRITGSNAWFSLGENTVHVNGEVPDVAREAVFHLTHALVLNSFRRTVGGNGSIAPWAERALAEGFAAAYRDNDGVASWEYGQPILSLFQSHASDDEPLELKKLIGASYGAYNTGTDARRYIAQSYTLMSFLVHGGKGKYREGLAEYLRSSFKGKSALTHLLKALDVKEKVLEEEWTAYVMDVAGR